MAHSTFPSDIPVPVDDGAADHLKGAQLPSIALSSTSGGQVDLSRLSGLTVVFAYPRTAAPDETVPDSWNQIPGARGCTPQNMCFRDNSPQILELGASQIFGLSTQDTHYQQEVKHRLNLPFDLLSDAQLSFAEALALPTFAWEDKRLTKRTTLIIEDGKITKVFYPVFPPDQSASEVIAWLKTRK